MCQTGVTDAPAEMELIGQSELDLWFCSTKPAEQLWNKTIKCSLLFILYGHKKNKPSEKICNVVEKVD